MWCVVYWPVCVVCCTGLYAEVIKCPPHSLPYYFEAGSLPETTACVVSQMNWHQQAPGLLWSHLTQHWAKGVPCSDGAGTQTRVLMVLWQGLLTTKLCHQTQTHIFNDLLFCACVGAGTCAGIREKLPWSPFLLHHRRVTLGSRALVASTFPAKPPHQPSAQY